MTRILSVGLALGLGAVSLGWSGCSHLSRGTSLDGERIEFIKDGVTPRAQVIYNLGEPLFDFPAHRVIGYEWETVDVAFLGRSSKETDCCEAIPYCMTEVEWAREQQRREEAKRERRAKRGPGYLPPDIHILFVQFDRSKWVVRHGAVVMKEDEAIKDVLLEWLKNK
jgi:outer membrane protein assembly factor BamE (lipoprotein component of BamABCDE complex)